MISTICIMSPFSSASFKLALKAPSVKLDGVITGECKIGVQGVKGTSIIPMESVMLVPKIVCPKELYHTEYKCNIIKLAIKQGKKQETKFPLKNLGDMPVTLDLSFYQPKNVEEDPQSQCLLHPSDCDYSSTGDCYYKYRTEESEDIRQARKYRE